jgi:hypothetical protein
LPSDEPYPPILSPPGSYISGAHKSITLATATAGAGGFFGATGWKAPAQDPDSMQCQQTLGHMGHMGHMSHMSADTTCWKALEPKSLTPRTPHGPHGSHEH